MAPEKIKTKAFIWFIWWLDWALTLIFDNGSWQNVNDFNSNNSTCSLPRSKMFSLLKHGAMRRLWKLLSLFVTLLFLRFCFPFILIFLLLNHISKEFATAIQLQIQCWVIIYQKQPLGTRPITPITCKLLKGVCHATKVFSQFPQLNSS